MSLLSLLPACFLRQGPSLELTDYQSVQDSLPRRPREDLPVSVSTKGEIRGMCHTARPSFSMDARDPSTGPHACTTSSTEPCAHPQALYFCVLKYVNSGQLRTSLSIQKMPESPPSSPAAAILGRTMALCPFFYKVVCACLTFKGSNNGRALRRSEEGERDRERRNFCAPPTHTLSSVNPRLPVAAWGPHK